MKSVGVRELKNHLSSYLRDVERGEVVVVTDHGRVMAEIRRPGEAVMSQLPDEVVRQRLIDEGLLIPRKQAPDTGFWRKVRAKSPRLARGTVQEYLDADREDHL